MQEGRSVCCLVIKMGASQGSCPELRPQAIALQKQEKPTSTENSKPAWNLVYFLYLHCISRYKILVLKCRASCHGSFSMVYVNAAVC